MDNQKVATAIARKLLVVVWNVLTRRELDHELRPDKVGASLMDWGVKHRLATSLGIKREEFTAKQLDQLGIQLKKVKYCTRIYPIPIISNSSSAQKQCLARSVHQFRGKPIKAQLEDLGREDNA